MLSIVNGYNVMSMYDSLQDLWRLSASGLPRLVLVTETNYIHRSFQAELCPL